MLMVKYVAKLKNGITEILTEKEISEYLHFFSSEEIAHIKETHKKPSKEYVV
jgi:hypothetical protein